MYKSAETTDQASIFVIDGLPMIRFYFEDGSQEDFEFDPSDRDALLAFRAAGGSITLGAGEALGGTAHKLMHLLGDEDLLTYLYDREFGRNPYLPRERIEILYGEAAGAGDDDLAANAAKYLESKDAEALRNCGDCMIEAYIRSMD